MMSAEAIRLPLWLVKKAMDMTRAAFLQSDSLAENEKGRLDSYMASSTKYFIYNFRIM
jgi:hypothetical protein